MKRQLLYLLIGAALIVLLISLGTFIYVKRKYHSLSKSNIQTLEQSIQQVPQEKIDNVIASLKESIRKDPLNAETHMALGMMYHKNNSLDDALSELKMALTIKPDLIAIYQQMYLVYKKKGMEEEADNALASYEKLRESK